MDSHVSSVACCAVVGAHFVYFSLYQKDFNSGSSTKQTDNEEYDRGKYRKQIPQDINQKSKSD
jgi:hypothetical protein